MPVGRSDLGEKAIDSFCRCSDVVKASGVDQIVAFTLHWLLSGLCFIESNQDQMIGTTVSHHRILEKLGEGGMGVVYRARDLRLDRFVCVKVFRA